MGLEQGRLGQKHVSILDEMASTQIRIKKMREKAEGAIEGERERDECLGRVLGYIKIN